MRVKAKQITPTQLKNIIIAEAKKIQETLEQGKDDPTKVRAEEVDPEDLADTLAKNVDHMKALKIKETRLRTELAKVENRKKAVRSKIMKGLK